MTWTVVGQQGDYVHVGYDAVTDPYAGDTTIDQFLPILCILVDGRPAPSGIAFGTYSGWSGGAVQATPPIAATVLTSQQQGDEICAETFGTGWRLAEFHDAGGWSLWASGSLPAATRFWVAINDQPANPWNSAGLIPLVSMPKFIPSETPVPGQYLAMFNENIAESQVESLANSLVATYGGTVLDHFTAVLGFSFTANEAQAQAMSQDSRIESVEQDSYGQPTEYWHLDRIDQRNLPLDNSYMAPNTGAGVNIYVLDTGFRRSHQEFGGRARQDADFIRFLGSRDDCNGHGTQVGSVAGGSTVGVARGANLISIRIAGCQGNAYNPAVSVFSSTIVAGLDWVARFHIKPAVANVSYGFSPGFWRRWFNSRTPMDRAVRRAVQAGVTVVVSAGNEGKHADRSTPARAAEAISVSATDRWDTRPSFANYGKVNLFAPGVDVVVADLAGDAAYVIRTGTSYSAPIVAGAAALYLRDHPTASPAEVRQALESNATPNVVQNPGPGSANRLLFVGPSLPNNLARTATASASSTYCSSGGTPGPHCYSPARVNDGSRSVALGGLDSWVNNAVPLPQWVQLTWSSPVTVSRVDLYTTDGFRIRDYDVQTWNTFLGWTTRLSVRGNTAVSRTHPLSSPVSTTRLRILALSGSTQQPGYARINEIEVY